VAVGADDDVGGAEGGGAVGDGACGMAGDDLDGDGEAAGAELVAEFGDAGGRGLLVGGEDAGEALGRRGVGLEENGRDEDGEKRERSLERGGQAGGLGDDGISDAAEIERGEDGFHGRSVGGGGAGTKR